MDTEPSGLVAVCAASGALGRLVVDRLLDRLPAEQIAVVVRRPAAVADLAARGVQVRHGDYDRPESLVKAFDAAARLLLISSPELDPGRRVSQHLGAVEAARSAGVGALAYTSVLGADVSDAGVAAAHHATEKAILASGLPYTMLRHPFYSEAFLAPQALRAAVTAGELADPTAGRGINTAFRADLAGAAVQVLTGSGHAGRGYDLTGPPWTYPELAATLTRVSGVPVACRPQPQEIPGPMGWLYAQARAGTLERQTDDLAHLLGHPATTVEQAVTAALTATA
ncbi:NAD(P)H dehydrogenase (quinone) [Thermomonospora echinospora]|uniref:NAD(P)H dehydrogenase (Quinone) n=1 Tax=Thermomonospora echinospora TaxID=1992 RepID=A0A1H5TYH5_9ACTN|nr:NAD(P)H-binding protein [Thermomonospora echinospora]SEF67081.1 NAD(P)H dehydrogenase (quinone) [Thermomonospora echinospora]